MADRSDYERNPSRIKQTFSLTCTDAAESAFAVRASASRTAIRGLKGVWLPSLPGRTLPRSGQDYRVDYDGWGFGSTLSPSSSRELLLRLTTLVAHEGVSGKSERYARAILRTFVKARRFPRATYHRDRRRGLVRPPGTQSFKRQWALDALAATISSMAPLCSLALMNCVHGPLRERPVDPSSNCGLHSSRGPFFSYAGGGQRTGSTPTDCRRRAAWLLTSRARCEFGRGRE
ncbi:hypothetical protein R1flu_009884 [Riccia fluitans]|uniref:Uncharacterized protein n=1 Tax=Riccia fluitans TaxID=41844 RepID=A0ABD1Z3E2_9MARC